MAEIKVGKRKLSINLSFLALTDTIKHARAQKSPKKKFEHPNGVVGLGILAALNHHHHHHHHQDPVFIKTSVLGLSPLSNPIRIHSSKSFCRGNIISEKKLSVEEMELCEEYTCVISHAGDKFIKKREYFEADILVNDDVAHKVFSVANGNGGEVSDFLNSCFLCGKMLHGLDIFMYRGEKAFCSAECRNMQISKDEQTEKCRSEARKPKKYSISPCAGTIVFYGGVTAA